MKIAVKYCGGCNSRIDRYGLIQLIEKEMQGHDIQFVSFADSDFDVLITINGCHTNCGINNIEQYMKPKAKHINVHEFIVDDIYCSSLEEMTDVIVKKIKQLQQVA